MNGIKFLSLILGLVLFTNCMDKKQQEKPVNNMDTKNKPIIIAHRGGAKLAPENTIAAFKNAINIGVDMIEIDVHLSKDSEVIVIHDDALDRTTNGKGAIKDLTLEEIKKYDAGSWFNTTFKNEKVSTLAEVLNSINGQAKLLIEIKSGDEKYPGLEKKVVEAIKEKNALDWVVVQSFNENSILRIKEMYPELSTYYLMGNSFNEFYDDLEKKMASNESFEKRFNGVAPRHSLLDADKVKLLHKAGFGVYTYTVNDSEDIQKVIEIGVDGIITDVPDFLKDRLRQ